MDLLQIEFQQPPPASASSIGLPESAQMASAARPVSPNNRPSSPRKDASSVAGHGESSFSVFVKKLILIEYLTPLIGIYSFFGNALANCCF